MIYVWTDNDCLIAGAVDTKRIVGFAYDGTSPWDDRRYILKLDYGHTLTVSTSDMQNILSAMTEDSRRRKPGKWIHHKPFDCEHHNCNTCIECSCCGTWFGADSYAQTNYCPNCGAYMREEGGQDG